MQQLEPPLTALIATAVELFVAWLIFRVVPKSWGENRVAAYVIVSVFLVAVNWALISLSVSGWLAKPENASTVQAVSTAAQAMFAVVLIGVAVFTLRANADMARETKRMAEVAVQQQRAATRPVLAFRIHPPEGGSAPDASEFVTEAFNVGAGPALDARVFYTGPFNFAEPTDYVQPCTIAAGEAATFTFKLDKDSPWQDQSDPLKWPRTEEDAELEQESHALRNAPAALLQDSPENKRRGEVHRKLQIRSNRYFADLTARIAERHDIGQIRAEYRDLSGAAHESTADLLVINPQSRRAVEQKADQLGELPESPSFHPYWPDLMLGRLSVDPTPALPDLSRSGR